MTRQYQFADYPNMTFGYDEILKELDPVDQQDIAHELDGLTVGQSLERTYGPGMVMTIRRIA